MSPVLLPMLRPVGRPLAEFPGDHGGFLLQPDDFAQALDQVLTQPTR